MATPSKLTVPARIFLRQYVNLLPNYALAKFIGVVPLTLGKFLKKMGLVKKQLPQVAFYPWIFQEADFAELQPEEMRRLRAIRFQHLVEESWKLYPKRYSAEDLSMAEVIILYRQVLPAIVISKLFDVDRQRVNVRSRQLGIRVPNETKARLQTEFYRRTTVPALSRLSTKQQQQVTSIYAAIRSDFLACAEARSDEARSGMLEKMESTKSEYRKTHPREQLYKCPGGACKSSWPRGKPWFFQQALAADGLERCCKYCYSVGKVAKKAKPLKSGSSRPKQKLMPKEQEVQIVKVFESYGNEVPSMYWRKLFNLGKTQFLRLRKLAGLSFTEGQSRRLLVQWRNSEPSELSNWTVLTPEERAALFRIWNADRSEYLLAMALQDRQRMEQMDAEVDRLRLVAQRYPLKQCQGECGRERPDTPWFFPNVVRGKNGRLCRYCFNRSLRKIR